MFKNKLWIFLLSLVVIGAVFYKWGLNNNKPVKVPEPVSEISTPIPFSPSPSASANVTISPQKPIIKTMDGLIIEDITIGTGLEAVAGKKITVNYLGTLTNGTKFDSSYDRGIPFQFTLGAGEVIKGWDEGFSGMKIGGKRKLTISPELGYGSAAIGSIPANSTLVFEVELLKVE